MSREFFHRYEPPTEEAADRTITFLTLHGTGANENDLVPIARLIAPGVCVISPRGQVSEHGSLRFFERYTVGELNVEDLKARTEDLAGFIDDACMHYHRDRSRVIALGFSNGANIAASLLFKHPDALAGAILLRPMVPYELDETLPPRPAVPPRVLVLAGSVDPLIDEGVPERLVEMLKTVGCDATLGWSPMAHAIGPRDITLSKALVATFTAPPSRP